MAAEVISSRVHVLGCAVDALGLDQATERLVEMASRPGSQPRLAVTLNPEMVMRARRDPGFSRLVESAELVTADGIGLVRAIRRRGFAVSRVAGVELVDAYLARAAELGHRVAMVGGYHGVAQAAAEQYRATHPGLQLVVDSGDPVAETAARVAAGKPNMVLAAYGPGKQERFLWDHLAAMGANAGVGVGGTFDFASGRIRRAPAVVRRFGMEWMWRLLRQPWRTRRQLALPAFWWMERREANQLRNRKV